MTDLPRELQVRVLWHLCSDVEVRVRLGLVRKLRVPAEVVCRLGDALSRRHVHVSTTLLDNADRSLVIRRITSVSLGQNGGPTRYILRQVQLSGDDGGRDFEWRQLIHMRELSVFTIHVIWSDSI